MVSGRFLPPSSDRTFSQFVLRTTFNFTQDEVDALRCTKAKSLEVDVVTYSGIKGGLRGWDSNLPDSYLDTEAFDAEKSRVLTVGTQSAKMIEPNKEYFTEITLTELGIDAGKGYAELYLNFQRGHWTHISNLKERVSCDGHGASDPAWCIFPDESKLMKNDSGSVPRISFDNNYPVLDSATWGRHRRTELRPGDRINSGDRIYSPNGLNTLVTQPDGNLVEYIPGGQVAWSSGTSVPESILITQSDGNLVIIAPGNRPVWQTGTLQAETVFQLQDDRNFVAYAPGHVAIWSNNAAGK